MYLESTDAAGESRMLDERALPAARDLATARPDVVVFGCTSASALRGNAYEAELIRRISEATGVPTVSTMRSVREVLRQRGMTRLVVATPYVDDLNGPMKASLESDGFEVLNIRGLQIRDGFALACVPGERILSFVEQTLKGFQPDGLFVSCTNFPVMSLLDDLRRTYPFPVASSNEAVLEKAIASAH
jgi:maleate isomerase